MEFYVLREHSKKRLRSVYRANENRISITCEICGGIKSQHDGPLVISYDGRGERGDYYRLPFCKSRIYKRIGRAKKKDN